jgi:thioredoxin-like negative regulator of GroEL
MEVLNSCQPVLVRFYAGWSAPCLALSRAIDNVAGDDSFSIKICRVDVEAQEQLTDQCGVRVVPTLMIFNLGMVTARMEGAATGEAVRDMLERAPWVSSGRCAGELVSL